MITRCSFSYPFLSSRETLSFSLSVFKLSFDTCVCSNEVQHSQFFNFNLSLNACTIKYNSYNYLINFIKPRSTLTIQMRTNRVIIIKKYPFQQLFQKLESTLSISKRFFLNHNHLFFVDPKHTPTPFPFFNKPLLHRVTTPVVTTLEK